MPYDPNHPPEKVKKLSPKKQRQWCHVINDAFKEGDSEGTAHAKAWGVVKKSSTDELVNVSESEGSLADATRNSDILNATDDVLVAKDMVRIAKELEALDA